MKDLPSVALFFALCSFSAANAQTKDCNCLTDFDFVVEKTKQNYSGYRDKVTSATQAGFEQHTQERRELAKTSNNDDCYKVINNWLAFFKDRHINASVAYKPAVTETDPVKLRQLFANTENIKLTEKEARKYLDKNKRKLDPVEGIYGNSIYRVAIIKNKATGCDFAGIILKADSKK